MQRLSASEILALWEVGQFQFSPDRALNLLAASYPQTTRAELERLHIGKRDALLLALREKMFGPQFSGLTKCPKCSANLELEFDSPAIRTEVSDEAAEPFSIDLGEFEFTCRLPNSADLIAVMHRGDPDSVAAALLDRCLLDKRRHGVEVSTSSLPAKAVDAIGAEMAKRDPQADIRFALVCPDCEHQWEAMFDIVSFAWNEISAWAGRLLRQVHTLSLAYGWRELDILSMSSPRRQAYLEMLGE